MTSPLSDSDQLVIARVARSPSGATAVDIARAHLGGRAKRHSVDALNMIGLAVACRLVGLQMLVPTKANKFRLP
jgi:hypothetical protein